MSEPFIKFMQSTNGWYDGGPLMAEGHLAKDAWNAAIDECVAQSTDETMIERLRSLKYSESSHSRIYDKSYGDDRLCECGHSYYRHFDTYENMADVGCKYCQCYTFVQAAEKPMPKLVIRTLTVEDLSNGYLDLLRVWKKADLTLDQATAILELRTKSGTQTYVVLLDDQIIGTASLIIDHKFINNGGVAGFVEDVVVLTERRRQGFGSAMLQHIQAEAAKLGLYKVALTCEEDNEPFYEKSGFYRHERQMRWDCPKE